MKVMFDNMFGEETGDVQSDFIPLMSDEDSTPLACQSGDVMPVLPLRNMVLYPQVVMPVSVGRKKSLKLIREVYNNSGELFVTTQRDARVEEPTLNDLYPIGTIARIIRILEMPDGSTTVILQGKQRAKILQVNALDPYMMASVDLLTESFPKDDDRVFVALLEAIKELAVKIIKNSGSMPEEASFAIRNIEQPSSLINFICANFGLKLTEKERLLELDDMKERGYQLLDVLTKESQLLEIKASIQSKARLDMDQQQREYYLQQQMKTIQEELGGGGAEQEISSFREKAKTKKWDVKTAEVFQKELAKLERTHPHAPDYSVQLNYVETLVNLPWNDYTNDNFDLKKAQKVLDRDHFGLDKVKERIIEHLAVLKLKGDLKAPIICLYGPPGVGKTSLGKSIA